MQTAVSVLTVTFQDPFWIGLYERQEDGQYQVCKITFGAEPKDYEVYHYLLAHWQDLSFSPPLPVGEAPSPHAINPKRLQRQIKKQLQTPAMGTKAQNAMKQQQEERLQARNALRRERRAQAQERQYQLRRQKHKEKHRGH